MKSSQRAKPFFHNLFKFRIVVAVAVRNPEMSQSRGAAVAFAVAACQRVLLCGDRGCAVINTFERGFRGGRGGLGAGIGPLLLLGALFSCTSLPLPSITDHTQRQICEQLRPKI